MDGLKHAHLQKGQSPRAPRPTYNSEYKLYI